MKRGDIVITYDERVGLLLNDKCCDLFPYIVEFTDGVELLRENDIVKAGWIDAIIFRIVMWAKGKAIGKVK